MHTILRVTMTDVEAANEAINNGRLQQIIQATEKLIKPESSFFYSDGGYRSGLFVFDMKDASMIPQIAEPLFTELNAKVEFLPTMNSEELGRGLEMWKKKSTLESQQLS